MKAFSPIILIIADWYIGESLDAGRAPVFTYYVMLATQPNAYAEGISQYIVVPSRLTYALSGQAEAEKINNAQAMVSYFNNWILLLQQVGISSSISHSLAVHIAVFLSLLK